jgi:hypothetical protein
MLKDMSAGVNRILTGLRPSPGVKRVNLALQGGGAHGAFTWGVLDYLLEDGRLAFSGVSGASAGAINAVMLADGLARGAGSVAGAVPGRRLAGADVRRRDVAPDEPV